MTQQTINKHYYKRIGVCPYCHKNRLFGEEKSCPECRAKSTEYSRKRDRISYNKTHAEWSKKTYEERKSKGICTRCGKRKAKPGQLRCEFCIKKADESRRVRDWHLSRFERGLCRWCDNPIEPGYKVCEFHHKMNIEKSRKRGNVYVKTNCTVS